MIALCLIGGLLAAVGVLVGALLQAAHRGDLAMEDFFQHFSPTEDNCAQRGSANGGHQLTADSEGDSL